MPVNPAAVDDIAAAVAGVYSEAELALLRIVTRHLADGVDAPDWAVRRLTEVAAVRRAAQLVVDAVESRGRAMARAAVAAGYRAGNAAAVVDLAGRVAGDVGHLARGADRRHGSAVQALADALVDELRPVHEAILPATVNAYRRAVAAGTARALAGRIPTRQAAQAAWAGLVDRGITGFTDVAGRRWRLHSYVEMAVRTAAARAVVAGLADEYTAAGHRLVYVSDHRGECDLCRPWEHRVLALSGLTGLVTERDDRTGRPVTVYVAATLAEARAQGLFHPNCLHSIAAYRPGRTRLAPARPDPAGNAARVRQRYLERGLRHWRERHAAALTPAGRVVAEQRIRTWDAELGRHLATYPRLRRLRHREEPGAGWEAPDGRRDDTALLLAG